MLVRFTVDEYNKEINAVQKSIGQKMKNKEPADDLLAKKNDLTTKRDNTKKLVDAKEKERDSKVILIGNLVHDSVPVSNDEVWTT
jgi:seryl-tRNA synthetase